MDSQLEMFTSAAERGDQAIAKVHSNSDGWVDLAVCVLETILLELPPIFIPEDWKVKIRPLIPKPHSENCWGAVARMAIKRGLVEKTGQYGRSRLFPSNGTEAPYYRRCGT